VADSLGTTPSELDRLTGLVASLRREHGNRVAELHARAQTMAALERENATLRRLAEAARAVARAPYPGAILAGLEAMGFALRDLDGEVPLSCAVIIPREVLVSSSPKLATAAARDRNVTTTDAER